MEYLSGLVANYSFTVLFALKKLGEQKLSYQDLDEMEKFIKLQRFYLTYQDITDEWENMEVSEDQNILIFFNKHQAIPGSFSNTIKSLFFGEDTKQFMLDNKNNINKVFLDQKRTYHRMPRTGMVISPSMSYMEINEIRSYMMKSQP